MPRSRGQGDGNALNFVFVDGHGEFLKRHGTVASQVEWDKWNSSVTWPGTDNYYISGE